MTTRQTSVAAYEHLISTGQLRGQQQAVMAALLSLGKGTSGEVIARLGHKNVNAWRARFTELSGRGLIREVGARKCGVTGRIGVVWEPTGRDKPLHSTKGARVAAGDSKAWRRVARELNRALHDVINNVDSQATERGRQAMALYHRAMSGDRK